jgi:hypothetical protein
MQNEVAQHIVLPPLLVLTAVFLTAKDFIPLFDRLFLRKIQTTMKTAHHIIFLFMGTNYFCCRFMQMVLTFPVTEHQPYNIEADCKQNKENY